MKFTEFVPKLARVFLVLVFVGPGSAHSAEKLAPRAKQPGIVSSAPLFTEAPFPQCHASTIVETKSGLVAAWFGGTKEGATDVGIWLSRHVGGRWTPVVEVANARETERDPVHCLNPVLFQVPGGPLLLFYKTGKWWAYVKSSTDDGVSWSKPERLYNGLFGPVKNKPVLLSDGSILSPTSTEHTGVEPGRMWRTHFERSTNGGKTWQFIGPVNDGGAIDAIQPSILVHPGKRLQALGRSAQGKIFEIWSEDEGRTWGRVALMELPNPNSGTDAVTLRDGRHVLVYNHSTIQPDGRNGPRSPLNVAVSRDGKQWQAALVLEDQPGEFSYPAVIQTNDGLVHITYTWRRTGIRHVVVDPARLVLRPISGGKWPE